MYKKSGVRLKILQFKFKLTTNNMERRNIFLCFMLVQVVGLWAQGAGYVERQLLCALDQAPCDAWGRQVKGK